ncbi:hypothetical protein ABVK25_007846 [Lepraria finkii]|uniref:HMG box domain-containing protein n=1 Tax=Lepraria finkii TaxID=1340010 RepID=A0ABR4B4V4_9LECA
MLQDHRQVKGVTGAYTRFYIDRQASGDFKGLKAKEAARLAGREWKGLSASEKKPYEDAQKQDQARYAQEVKTVYNRDVMNRPQAASAA